MWTGVIAEMCGSLLTFVKWARWLSLVVTAISKTEQRSDSL